MGEAYHEGITAEEVNTFFADKNFADLSTGQYVDKNKYDRDIQALNTTIAEKQNALNAKLTDDEKASQAREADKEKIKELTALLQQNTITSNKTMAGGLLAQAKSILGLKDDDADYGSFIDSIVSDDANKTNSIAKYVAKLTKDAYEKGKHECKGNEVKGEILEYNGRVCYDTADVVKCIINRIEEEKDNDYSSERDKVIYELSQIIQAEFLIPLRPPVPKAVSAER